MTKGTSYHCVAAVASRQREKCPGGDYSADVAREPRARVNAIKPGHLDTTTEESRPVH
jgi:hypothetical protein